MWDSSRQWPTCTVVGFYTETSGLRTFSSQRIFEAPRSSQEPSLLCNVNLRLLTWLFACHAFGLRGPVLVNFGNACCFEDVSCLSARRTARAAARLEAKARRDEETPSCDWGTSWSRGWVHRAGSHRRALGDSGSRKRRLQPLGDRSGCSRAEKCAARCAGTAATVLLMLTGIEPCNEAHEASNRVPSEKPPCAFRVLLHFPREAKSAEQTLTGNARLDELAASKLSQSTVRASGEPSAAARGTGTPRGATFAALARPPCCSAFSRGTRGSAPRRVRPGQELRSACACYALAL